MSVSLPLRSMKLNKMIIPRLLSHTMPLVHATSKSTLGSRLLSSRPLCLQALRTTLQLDKKSDAWASYSASDGAQTDNELEMTMTPSSAPHGSPKLSTPNGSHGQWGPDDRNMKKLTVPTLNPGTHCSTNAEEINKFQRCVLLLLHWETKYILSRNPISEFENF